MRSKWTFPPAAAPLPAVVAVAGLSRAGRWATAGLWATLLITVWETWSTVRALPELRVELFAQCLALNLWAALRLFAPTLIFVMLMALLATLPSSSAHLGRARRALELLAAGGAVLAAHRTLAYYPPFAAARSVQLAFAVCFGYVAAACWLGRQRAGGGAPAARRLLGRAGMVLGLGGAAAALVLHRKLYVNEYPSLHASLVQLAHLLTVLGLWHALERPWARAARLGRGSWVSALAAAASCTPLLVARALGLSEPARPVYLSASAFGLGEALYAPYSEAREVPAQPVADAPDALRRFRQLAQLPELPAPFDLAQYDVLLVLIESTRFDQTSLGNPALGTTPALLRLQEQGAFSFTRAYSPSSATFLALAGIFGMSYPALLPLETWNKPWTGRLLPASQTAAETFRAAGYDTFWVGHDHRSSFSHALLGFEAGFAERVLVGGDERTDTGLDARIADRASAALAARAAASDPFFGFVFFVSPHYPYLAHHADRAHTTELSRYRQELQASDAQLERLLAELERSARKERTIVIVMGDHGEEFGEHGGHQHHSNVYVESLHVPLLVRIPGVTGWRVEAPISSAYILPWLLSHGSSAQKASIEARLARELVPMLEATEGAVIAEILGHDRVKSALLYADTAFIHDFFAERSEAYRLDSDPGQTRDRFASDTELAARARRQIAAYQNVRADRHRFRLRPEILDPRNAR